MGARPVFKYHERVVESPPGIAAYYRRSGHIHPLYNPRGQSLTDDFAPDHAHQHGVFFAWVQATHRGRTLDFWNQAKRDARVEFVGQKGPPVSGSVFGELAAIHSHSDITNPDRPELVLRETWTLRIYNVADYFLFDLISEHTCPADSATVRIEKHHYGGLAIRGNRQWFGDGDGRSEASAASSFGFLTSEGKTRTDGNATAARWVEMHGNIDSQPTGVSVMCHPKNFRAPQPVRLHPSKPYFCFAPMIDGEFEIAPGRSFTSRYRYYIHNGAADAEQSERHWRDYAHPPVARVIEK